MALVGASVAAEAVYALADLNYVHSQSTRETLRLWRSTLQTGRVSDERRRTENNCNCSSNACVDIGEVQSFSIWLELMEDCNLDCIFCYNPWRPADSDLRARELLSYGDLVMALEGVFSKVAIDHVTLSGGEPLMYAQLTELVRFVKNACTSIGITTNGRSLTQNRTTQLARAGVNHVSVPLHSGDPAVHDELAGGISWRSAVRALAFSLDSATTTTMTSVVTRKNLLTVMNAVEIGLELGVGAIVMNCFHPTGQGAREIALAPSRLDFEGLVQEVERRVDGRADVLVGSPHSENEKKTAVDRLVFSPYGDIKFCNQSADGVVNFKEDPKSFNSLLDALASNSYSQYLARIDSCTCF